MLYPDRENVLRIKMILGNACFLRTLVNGVFLLQACMHYDGWFLVVNNRFAWAYTTKACIHFHGINVKVGFMAHSFSQDRNREAVPTTRRNGNFENAYPSL